MLICKNSLKFIILTLILNLIDQNLHIWVVLSKYSFVSYTLRKGRGFTEFIVDSFTHFPLELYVKSKGFFEPPLRSSLR